MNVQAAGVFNEARFRNLFMKKLILDRVVPLSSRRQGSTFIMMLGPFSTDGDACEQELR
jgi:hypothetical protein